MQVLNKDKVAMSPSFTVHGGQYDTKYVTFEQIVQAAFVGVKFSKVVFVGYVQNHTRGIYPGYLLPYKELV